MPRGKFPNLPELLPIPDRTKLIVKHHHHENSNGSKRTGKRGGLVPYVTEAELRDEETNQVLTKAKAICNPIDVPNRKLGYTIARNRVIKQYHRNIVV